jgi:hypothetical protein
MPSPLGEGQTDTPINHHHLGEVQADTPINPHHLGEVPPVPSETVFICRQSPIAKLTPNPNDIS